MSKWPYFILILLLALMPLLAFATQAAQVPAGSPQPQGTIAVATQPNTPQLAPDLQPFDQIVISGFIAWLLEKAKKLKSIPWISQETTRLNTFISAAVALAATLGIHFQFDHVAGVLTVSGLTLVSIRHLAWDWGKSFFAQEFVRKTALRSGTRAADGPPPPPTMIAATATA